MKNLLIFRKRLLPFSETFIRAQSLYLKNFTPHYAGFEKDNSGFDSISSSPTFLLSEYDKFLDIKKFLLKKNLLKSSHWLKQLKQSNLSIIHAHFASDALYAKNIASCLNTPLVTSLHGSDITKTKNHKFLEPVFNSSSLILCISKFIYNKALSLGAKQNNLVQHYTGIDTNYFSIDKQESVSPLILFIGRVVTNKGVWEICQAFKAITVKYRTAQLVILGDGPELPKLKLYAQANSLNIHFLGNVNADKIKSLLSRAWVMCVPSKKLTDGTEEGLGMCYLEAQACQTPVIGTSIGGIPEAIVHGKSGILINENSEHELISALFQLLDNKKLRLNMGKFSREYTINKFDLMTQNKKLEQLYKAVL